MAEYYGVEQQNASWSPQLDEIVHGLSEDFDGSLAGLGSETGTAMYNMQDQILALPSFKTDIFTDPENHGFVGR